MSKINNKNQRGFVSIFTVLFFIVFIMVITVGFLRVVSQEQQQSTNDSLTASALSAAKSGIEDGKRALLLYNTTTDSSLKDSLRAAFDERRCDGIFNSSNGTIVDSLELSRDGKVAESANLQQSYTCLTITANTDDFVGKLSEGTSDIIPLRGEADFTKFSIGWHGTSPNLDGAPRAYSPGSQLRTRPAWLTAGYPALMRLQLIAVPKGTYSLDQIESQTQFIVPGKSGIIPYDVTMTGGLSVIGCQGFPPANVTAEYACTTNVVSPYPSADKILYLRVTALYRDTNIQLKLANATGPVKFDMVEPIVDSTGKTTDVYRRVQARVRLDGQVQLPEYVLETGNNLCKNFAVSPLQMYDDASCPIRSNDP
jgi:Tfp pilus assembly protein PilX